MPYHTSYLSVKVKKAWNLQNFRRISNQKFDCLEYLKLINYSGIINPPFTSLTYNSSVLERTLAKLLLQI